MGGARESRFSLAGYLPAAMVATVAVTLVPGLLVAGLRSVDVVSSWMMGIGVASALSLLIAAACSAWWVRRPASRDVVFADLMLWGWWRRWHTERRLANATWLLGRADHGDPDRGTELLERMSATLEARDPYTHGHSKRVTRHAFMIARTMGLSPEQAVRVRTAAALHDVGKVETPREVLNKPGRLTDEEFAIIKRHPVDGAEMVTGLADREVVAIVRHHHERLDGGGYPDGLRGAEIPLGARIIAVADTFDALTSTRSYRRGCSHKRALDILRKEAGTQLDPDAVAAFFRYYSGRRAIPVWAAVTAAPSRLGAWLSSAANGLSSAPLGGAAAIGAGFLVGGALVVPVTSQIARAADHALPPASQGTEVAGVSDSDVASRSRPREAARRAGAPGARKRRSESAGRAGSGGPAAGGNPERGGSQAPEGGASDGGSGAGGPGTGSGGSNGGGSGGGAPGDGGSPGLPDIPDAPRLPEADLPDVPQVEVPPAEVPPVRVGPVEVPPVKVPPVKLTP